MSKHQPDPDKVDDGSKSSLSEESWNPQVDASTLSVPSQVGSGQARSGQVKTGLALGVARSSQANSTSGVDPAVALHMHGGSLFFPESTLAAREEREG